MLLVSELCLVSSTLTRVTRLGMVNAYLVREDDGLTLVDAALPRSEKAILKAAQRIGAPIVRIALTHAHGDHIGSLDALAAQLPGVEVLITARDARLLAGDKSQDPGEGGKMRGSLPGAETRADAPHRPGRPDRLARGRRRPRPHARPRRVPRHARPRAALRRRVLDARRRRGAAKPTRGSRSSGSATCDRPRALETARALRALDPSRLAPGHGRIVERSRRRDGRRDRARGRLTWPARGSTARASWRRRPAIADAEGLDR